VADLFEKVTIEFKIEQSATNWSFSPFLCSMTHIELSNSRMPFFLAGGSAMENL